MGPGETYFPKTVLVTGSRDFTDKEAIRARLKWAKERGFKILVHGACRGADKLADEVGRELGFEVYDYPAHWTWHGKVAGSIRNSAMLYLHRVSLVLAFPLPGSRGTRNMIDLARSAGINTVIMR